MTQNSVEQVKEVAVSLFEKITLREHYRKKANKEVFGFLDEFMRSEYPPEVKSGTVRIKADQVTFTKPVIIYGALYVGAVKRGKKTTLTMHKSLMLFKRKGVKS